MTDTPRPAWAREGALLDIGDVPRLDDLTPEWAWGGADGTGVRVAVIDSGVEADHPQLGDCVDNDNGIAFGVQNGEVVSRTGPHADAFGHGTACTGIIHALAPKSRVTSVKVLGTGLRGKGAAFLAGLNWAVEEGFDVINLSLGTRKREWALAFHEVCDRAYFGNSFVVTAANNVQRRSYPSLYASVTSVACNLGDDPYRFHFNPEPPTEFLARGIDVDVAWLDGQSIRTTGNSYAAPHIAGLVALIRSKHPGLRPFQLKTVLWATSANVRGANEVEMAGKVTNAMRRPATAPATAS
jgi:subtilisin family serine protease